MYVVTITQKGKFFFKIENGAANLPCPKRGTENRIAIKRCLSKTFNIDANGNRECKYMLLSTMSYLYSFAIYLQGAMIPLIRPIQYTLYESMY